MFDENDVNHMMNTNTKIPDGIINGMQYATIFKEVSQFLEQTIPNDFQSNIRWVMNCINLCYGDNNEFSKERAADVVTSLSYICMTQNACLDELGYKEQFFTHQNDTVIPQLLSECETIPWYDFSDEIKQSLAEEMERENQEDNGSSAE